VQNSLPRRLPTRFLEKVWGAEDLMPWYPSSEKKIGEVWFEADLPLLVKFVFTAGRLSVQVHPDDTFAAAHEKSLGKTEMWYILRADPGAQIALGLREKLSRERLREAALSGEIEGLLNWQNVEAGDAFFVPAGAVHAIGAGLAICEIQQYSDVTYRLYDYGRPRELHLDKAIQVANTEPTSAKSVGLPIDCPYFHTELARITSPIRYVPAADRFHLLIFVSGWGVIGTEPFREGEAWLVPEGTTPFTIDPSAPVKFLRTWVPSP
jgi:mannose-6-phosphate isomerase